MFLFFWRFIMYVTGNNAKPPLIGGDYAPSLRVTTDPSKSNERVNDLSPRMQIPSVAPGAKPPVVQTVFSKMNTLIEHLRSVVTMKSTGAEKNKLSNIDNIKKLAKSKGLELKSITSRHIKEGDVIVVECLSGGTTKKTYEAYTAGGLKTPNDMGSVRELRNPHMLQQMSYTNPTSKYWVVTDAPKEPQKLSIFQRIAAAIRSIF